MSLDTILAEFHLHTGASPDSLVKIEPLLAACVRKGIGKLAITDHGSMQGAFEAKAMDPQRVILAEEIETTEGEILGYFMSSEVPQGLRPREVVDRLRDQGAFISIAHPFDSYRGNGWNVSDLEALLPLVDGIEVFNARCVRPRFNEQALSFAQQHEKLQLAGSDAHSIFELGHACLLLPDFNSAEEMRAAVGKAKVVGKLSGSYVHLISTYAKFAKRHFA